MSLTDTDKDEWIKVMAELEDKHGTGITADGAAISRQKKTDEAKPKETTIHVRMTVQSLLEDRIRLGLSGVNLHWSNGRIFTSLMWEQNRTTIDTTRSWLREQLVAAYEAGYEDGKAFEAGFEREEDQESLERARKKGRETAMTEVAHILGLSRLSPEAVLDNEVRKAILALKDEVVHKLQESVLSDAKLQLTAAAIGSRGVLNMILHECGMAIDDRLSTEDIKSQIVEEVRSARSKNKISPKTGIQDGEADTVSASRQQEIGERRAILWAMELLGYHPIGKEDDFGVATIKLKDELPRMIKADRHISFDEGVKSVRKQIDDYLRNRKLRLDQAVEDCAKIEQQMAASQKKKEDLKSEIAALVEVADMISEPDHE